MLKCSQKEILNSLLYSARAKTWDREVDGDGLSAHIVESGISKSIRENRQNYLLLVWED